MKKKNLKVNNNNVIDLTLSQEHIEEFERGIKYFNEGQFKHSFDAWELLSESADKSQKNFLHGLMDFATGCEQLVKDKDIDGAFKSFLKAKEKIEKEQYRPEFLGVSIEPFIDFIENFKENIKNNGSKETILKLIPKIQFHKPPNPDLVIELCEIVQSNGFLEGVKNFNLGLYWESHEIWEEIKREQVGEGRNFIEAFIQLADAYNFAKLSKIDSAIYLFDKLIKTLLTYKNIDCKLNISDVIEGAQNTLNDLRKLSVEGKSKDKFIKAPVIQI